MVTTTEVREPERTRKGKGRRWSSSQQNGSTGWSLLSAHGRVLFYIAVCPDIAVPEIAAALDLTERAVWGLVRDLRKWEMVRLNKRGRRHFYTVNMDAPLLHPTIRGITLRPILGKIAGRGNKDRAEVCN